MGELLSSCSVASVVWPPGAGRWSILEITAHLADAELLASARIRRIITQDRPEMRGYQQELWARSLAYGRQKIETVSARFMTLRLENVWLLEMIGEEVWRFKGRHDEYGELSLRHYDRRLHHAHRKASESNELRGGGVRSFKK